MADLTRQINTTNHCVLPPICCIQTTKNRRKNQRNSKAKADKWKGLSLQLTCLHRETYTHALERERQTNKNANLYELIDKISHFIWCVIVAEAQQGFDNPKNFRQKIATAAVNLLSIPKIRDGFSKAIYLAVLCIS